jgi:hypothetical protein
MGTHKHPHRHSKVKKQDLNIQNTALEEKPKSMMKIIGLLSQGLCSWQGNGFIWLFDKMLNEREAYRTKTGVCSKSAPLE